MGACPINGSVSRSGIADSLKVRSQVMSISASVTMLFILLFGTPYLRFLPIPVLTGIVITALLGILETKLAHRLWKMGKNEWIVFMVAFLGVLLFGTLYGVIIGVLLSFGEVAMRASQPPTAFVGRIPGHGNFYSLKRNSAARPIKNTIIYRFSGNLFFANVELFCEEIEGAIREDTHQIVVDGRGIGSIDSSATERLVQLYGSLRKRGILFYLTEHDGSLNDQLRRLGGGVLIEEGAVRRTITLALRDAGLEKPYELEEGNGVEGPDAPKGSELQAAQNVPESMDAPKGSEPTGMQNVPESMDAPKGSELKAVQNVPESMDETDGMKGRGRAEKPGVEDLNSPEGSRRSVEATERLSEFEWVFGADAEAKMEEVAVNMAEQLVLSGMNEKEFEDKMLDEEGVRTSWGLLGRFDEDAFWDFMEIRLEEMAGEGRISPELAARVERHIEKRREFGHKKLEEINPEAVRVLKRHGETIQNYIRHRHPVEYEKYLEMRKGTGKKGD